MSDETEPIDRVADDRRSGTVRARYDWSSMSPAAAVVKTVSVAEDREPETLDPIYDVVDPDALDAIFGRTTADARDPDIQVSLIYAGYRVTVRGDGVVTAEPLAPGPDA